MSLSQSDTLCNIYNQYTNTNVEKLVAGICNISKGYNAVSAAYLNGFFDINAATDDRLDNFGKQLGFNRYITFYDPLDLVLPHFPGIEEYEILIPPDYKKCRLTDDAYRRVLKVILQTRCTVASIRNLSQVISSTMDADVFVDDKLDMRYITYYFLDRIPGYLEVCIKNFDILPRPAGMATQYISAISRFFGFLIQSPHTNIEASGKLISGFWKSRFPETEGAVVYQPFEKFTTVTPNPIVTEEDAETWNRYLEQRNERETDYVNARAAITEREKYIASLVPRDRKTLANGLPRYINNLGMAPYVQALSHPDDMTQTRRYMQLAHLKTLQAYERTQHAQRYLVRQRDLSRHPAHADLRKRLVYDEATGWYFYKQSERRGNYLKDKNQNYVKDKKGNYVYEKIVYYKPEHIANVFQNNCGVWYPQQPLFYQTLSDYIELRAHDYATSEHESWIQSSPFTEKYKTVIHQAVGMDPNKTQIMRGIIERLHDSVKKWHSVAELHRKSFRACLDFEYRACTYIQYARALRNRGHTSDNPHLQYVYDSIVKYYGSTSNYDDWYSDYYTNTPAYKRRVYLRTCRALVRQAREFIENAKYQNERAVRNYFSSYSDQLQDLSASLQDLIDDLKTQPWLPIENGTFPGGHGMEYYSAVNINNENLTGSEYRHNVAEAGKWKNIKSHFDKAVGACAELSRMCNAGESTRGQYWNSWYCIMKDDTSDDFDFSDTTSSRKRTGHSWRDDGWNRENQQYYCQTKKVSGYYEEQQAQWELGMRKNARDRAQEKADRHQRAVDAIDQERYIRTLVTKRRNLKSVMEYYDSYYPSDIPELDATELDREYVDWTVPPDLPLPQQLTGVVNT